MGPDGCGLLLVHLPFDWRPLHARPLRFKAPPAPLTARVLSQKAYGQKLSLEVRRPENYIN